MTARDQMVAPEVVEPAVALRPMIAGAEVVEDYSHVGLTLRDHPVSFLRADLARRRMITCADASASRDRRRVEVASLVLVRQRPGSVKGVMFITIEDETSVANLVVWTAVFEAHRRIVLGAGMIAVRGRIQPRGRIVHLVAERLTDLSAEFASVGSRNTAFPLLHGRGDEFHHGSPGSDSRERPTRPKPRDIYVPERHVDTIRVTPRNFR